MSGAAETNTVRVPTTFRKRGGRKQVIAPDVHPYLCPAAPPER
jgi:hypothetical protein